VGTHGGEAALVVLIGLTARGTDGHPDVGRAVIVLTTAEIWDITGIIGGTAHSGVGLVAVGRTGSSSGAALGGIAGTARGAADLVDGLEVISRAVGGDTGALLLDVAVAGRGAAHSGIRGNTVGGTVHRASGAMLGDIAVTGRGAADGVEGLEGIGRAGGRVARAGLLDVARAHGRAADAVLESVSRALGTITVAVLSLVAFASGGAANKADGAGNILALAFEADRLLAATGVQLAGVALVVENAAEVGVGREGRWRGGSSSGTAVNSGISRALGRTTSAVLNQIARTSGGTAGGVHGPEVVGGAGGLLSVARLGDVTVTGGGTAEGIGGLNGVSGAFAAATIADFGNVALASGGTAGVAAVLLRIHDGAVVVDAIAGLGPVTGAGIRAADVAILLVVEADGTVSGAGVLQIALSKRGTADGTGGLEPGAEALSECVAGEGGAGV
jgi:hypothetical protein